MAGHSSWASIQRRSGRLAARRERERARTPRAGQQLVRFEGYGPGGAEDVVPNDDRSMEVLADPTELDTVRAVLTHRGFAPTTTEVTRRAASSLALSGESAELMVQLLATLQGLDEVRDVYSNAEIADEALGPL